MTAPRRPSSKLNCQSSQLQCLFLRGGVAHVSPTATIQELLHSSSTLDELTLQKRIKKVADNFTDKHKEVMSTLREETVSEEINFDDAIRELEAPTRPQTQSQDMMQKHSKRFNAIQSQVFTTRKTSTSSIVSSNLTYDYMSGVWRMLKAEREKEDFTISPHGYEFDAVKTKWVPKTDAAVQQIEESKQKCEEWLIKKCDSQVVKKAPLRSCLTKRLPKLKHIPNKLT